ncbi:MAG: PAS domain-containing protein [Deltaproteobacteria bacterium]|nr:PAS domain-containing protein [Deltaproteobacteria bacterium]
MTLRTKTSLTAAVIIVLTVSIISIVYLRYLEESIRSAIYKGLESVSTTAAHVISQFREDTFKDIQTIALALDEQALVAKDAETIEGQLKRLFGLFPKFKNGLLVLDIKGRLWLDYPSYKEFRGYDLSFRQYFQETLKRQEGLIGIPYHSVRTGQPVLNFTAPLFDADHKLTGVFCGVVILTSPEALQVIQTTRIGTQGYMYIFDRYRNIIIHPNAEMILKTLEPGDNRMIDKAIEGFVGAGETVNSKGVPMLISIKQIPGSDWFVAAQQPTEEAFAPLHEIQDRILLVAIPAVVAALILVSMMMVGVTRHIYKLKSAALFLGKQEVDKAADEEEERRFFRDIGSITSRDEVGELAETLQGIYRKLAGTMNSLRNFAGDWERTFNSVSDAIFIVDKDNKILRINRAAANLRNIEPKEAIGESFYRLMYGTNGLEGLGEEANGDVITGRPVKNELKSFYSDDFFEIISTPLVSAEGGIVGAVHIVKDITEAKKTQNELQRREEELKEKTRNLEETNIALKVLLERNERDKSGMEENLLYNVKALVLPYLDKLKATLSTPRQQRLMSAVETNLYEIASTFSRKMAFEFIQLTPKEVEAAHLIRLGKTNKEIADVQGISIRTVEFYRESIRKKMGIANRKVNLRDYLRELEKDSNVMVGEPASAGATPGSSKSFPTDRRNS